MKFQINLLLSGAQKPKIENQEKKISKNTFRVPTVLEIRFHKQLECPFNKGKNWVKKLCNLPKSYLTQIDSEYFKPNRYIK